MFKIKYRNNGLNTEKRSASNLSKRVFLCQEIKTSEKFNDIEIRINKKLLEKSTVENNDHSDTIQNDNENDDDDDDDDENNDNDKDNPEIYQKL